MTLTNIAIIGSSGHAKVIIDIVENQGLYSIAGLFDSYREVDDLTLGYKVLGKLSELPILLNRHGINGLLIAIGDNFSRSQVVTKIKNLCPDIEFVQAIHPRAYIGNDVEIGEGSVVMAGAVINSSSSVGEFCILNTNSSLDHDSVMKDFSSLAPGVVTGGNCHISCYSAVGIGATLAHGITVGEHAIIGAGSTVLDTVDSHVVAYGTPAEIIRSRKPGDQYL